MGGGLINSFLIAEIRDTAYPARLVLSQPDLYFGRELGQTLSEGWFVHVHPEIRYDLPEGAKSRWVGWDYIMEMPVVQRVRGHRGRILR
jgi:hypothetical protein